MSIQKNYTSSAEVKILPCFKHFTSLCAGSGFTNQKPLTIVIMTTATTKFYLVNICSHQFETQKMYFIVSMHRVCKIVKLLISTKNTNIRQSHRCSAVGGVFTVSLYQNRRLCVLLTYQIKFMSFENTYKETGKDKGMHKYFVTTAQSLK